MKHTFEFFEIEAGLYRQGQERYNEKKKKKKKEKNKIAHTFGMFKYNLR